MNFSFFYIYIYILNKIHLSMTLEQKNDIYMIEVKEDE